jgi:hypothetical protein
MADALPIADDPRQWSRHDPAAEARRELQWLRDAGGRVLAEREAQEGGNVPDAPRDCACNARLDDRLCPACTTWPYVCGHDPGIKGKGPLTLRDKLLARAAREEANG